MENKRFDWTGVTKRLSTWLGLLTTAAGAALAYYSQLTPVERAEWPWWVPVALAVLVPTLPALIPTATSYKQKSLNCDETDQAGV